MKKQIAFLFALVMVLCMAACAAGIDNGANDVSTATDTIENAVTVDNSKLYIPVMARDSQHAYWQAVSQGAQAAADDLGVEIHFIASDTVTNLDEQADMLKTELAKEPDAIVLSALSTSSLTEILAECAEKEIPVIGFDSGVPGDTTGAVKATVSTDHEVAAAIAAEKFGQNATIVAAMENATSDAPVIIGCLSQDAVSASVIDCTTGFVNRMVEIAEIYQPGKVSVEGHSTWESQVENPAIIIRVEVSANALTTSIQTSANALLNMEGITAIFCSNKSAVTGFLAATSDGTELGDGGKYDRLIVAGFDAGSAQKNAVRNGWFIGSVTKNPVQIGYKAVELAVSAANGEEVTDVDIDAKWYDATNIDDPDMAILVYDES